MSKFIPIFLMIFSFSYPYPGLAGERTDYEFDGIHYLCEKAPEGALKKQICKYDHVWTFDRKLEGFHYLYKFAEGNAAWLMRIDPSAKKVEVELVEYKCEGPTQYRYLEKRIGKFPKYWEAKVVSKRTTEWNYVLPGTILASLGWPICTVDSWDKERNRKKY